MRKEEARLRLLAADIITSFFKNSNTSVEVVLLDAKKMRVLNRNFRGIDRATNVLSFATPQDFPVRPGSPRVLGEVYLCPSVIKSKGEDIDYLMVHGLLHLMGLDHDKERARISMEKLEGRILAWLKNRF